MLFSGIGLNAQSVHFMGFLPWCRYLLAFSSVIKADHDMGFVLHITDYL